MRTRTTSLTLAAITTASVLGLASIAAAPQAEARGKRSAAAPTMATKSGPIVRDHRAGTTAARKLQCIGQYCPKQYGDKAQTTGTYKPLPPPIKNVRDHRGPNGGGGGVSVTSGPPRRSTICAGWGC